MTVRVEAGTKEVETPDDLRKRLSLTPERTEATDRSRRWPIENYHHRPQDIEWAVDDERPDLFIASEAATAD